MNIKQNHMTSRILCPMNFPISHYLLTIDIIPLLIRGITAIIISYRIQWDKDVSHDTVKEQVFCPNFGNQPSLDGCRFAKKTMRYKNEDI